MPFGVPEPYAFVSEIGEFVTEEDLIVKVACVEVPSSVAKTHVETGNQEFPGADQASPV